MRKDNLKQKNALIQQQAEKIAELEHLLQAAKESNSSQREEPQDRSSPRGETLT
jgi:hypothetical protein